MHENTTEPATAPDEDARPGRRRRIVIAGVSAALLCGCGIAATSAHASGGSGSGSSGSPSAPAAPAPPKAGNGTMPTPPKPDGKHVIIDGAVLSSTDTTIVVKDRDGFSRTIDTDSATKYQKDGKTISRESIDEGTNVHAVGAVDSDKTSLDASEVDVMTGAAGGPGMPGGRGMPGGHGPGGAGAPGGAGKPGAAGGSGPAGGSGAAGGPGAGKNAPTPPKAGSGAPSAPSGSDAPSAPSGSGAPSAPASPSAS